MGKLEKLAMIALKADLEKKEAERRAEEAKNNLIKAMEAAGKYNPDTTALGNVRTKIQENRFFDVDTAVQLVGEETAKKAEVTQIDAKILKAFMTQNDIEASMKSHKKPYKLSLEVLRD